MLIRLEDTIDHLYFIKKKVRCQMPSKMLIYCTAKPCGSGEGEWAGAKNTQWV